MNIEAKGQWLSTHNGDLVREGWEKNLVVSNAKKAIAAALGNQPATKSRRVVEASYVDSTKKITAAVAGEFATYSGEYTGHDYFLYGADNGSNSGSVGKIFLITAVGDDDFTLETALGANATADVYGWIFQGPPRFHNLFMALGTGSSSWDTETPAADGDATTLTNEYYRKPVESVVHIEEFTGVADSVGATSIVDTDFTANFGNDCVGQYVEIIDGTGVGQTRLITAFNNSTDTATVGTWTTNPTGATWRVGIPRLAPTGVIDVTARFPADERIANGSFRECGLFGANATQEIDSGELLNLFHHSVETKTNSVEVVKTCRLRFNIA